MSMVVLLVGIAVVVFCIAALVWTDRLLGLVETVLDSNWLYLAALLRLLIGAALIASAHAVKYPQLILALGWLSALGGILAVSVPRTVMAGLAQWIGGWPLVYMRLWLCFGLLFGAGIVFVALP